MQRLPSTARASSKKTLLPGLERRVHSAVGNISPSDHELAQCIGSPDAPDTQCFTCPQSLIDLMPTADEYIARLESLVRDFMPPDPVLTCTTLRWWFDRAVTHLCTRDVHAAPTTIQ
jgi:hypothetical protein